MIIPTSQEQYWLPLPLCQEMMLSCSRTLGLPPHLFMGNEQIFERPAPSTGMTLHETTRRYTRPSWSYLAGMTIYTNYCFIDISWYLYVRMKIRGLTLMMYGFMCLAAGKICWVLLPYRLSNAVFACFFSLIDRFNLLCVGMISVLMELHSSSFIHSVGGRWRHFLPLSFDLRPVINLYNLRESSLVLFALT